MSGGDVSPPEKCWCRCYEPSSFARTEDLAVLRRDTVADVVSDYGRLNTKILSLARLQALGGARSEIATLALGRSHVSRCVERQ